MDEFPRYLHALDAPRQRHVRRVVLHPLQHQLRSFESGDSILRDVSIPYHESVVGAAGGLRAACVAARVGVRYVLNDVQREHR